MRDIDVRRAMAQKVLRQHKDEPETLVLHELGLAGGVSRVDVAVVNGRLHGYEIKSERDTLERLDDQAHIYGRIFDHVTIVAGERHVSCIEARVPAWWGIKVATAGPRGAVYLRQERYAKGNPSPDPEMIASLLWRPEALDILERYGYAKGVKSKGKAAMYRRLAEKLSLSDLRAEVRAALKVRTHWRDH